ncbi:MAG: GtrA family protein [Bacteroidetes bacterium]|nr:GtrA family protein [Bacteroidota bacterium]
MKLVIKQITKFFIIGVSAVLVDFIVYYVMSDFMAINTDISKAFGFIIGTIYTYFLNKKWTWKHTEKSNKGMVFMFGIVYAVSFIFNLLINKYGLAYLPHNLISLTAQSSDGKISTLFAIKGEKFLAFFLATVVSAIINFIGQKFLVFKTVKLDPKDETNIEVS